MNICLNLLVCISWLKAIISAVRFPCELTEKQPYAFWEYRLARSSLKKASLLSTTGEGGALDESGRLCMSVRTFHITSVQKYQKSVREQQRGKKGLGGNNLCLVMEREGDCIQSHKAFLAPVDFIAGEKSCGRQEAREGLI